MAQSCVSVKIEPQNIRSPIHENWTLKNFSPYDNSCLYCMITATYNHCSAIIRDIQMVISLRSSFIRLVFDPHQQKWSWGILVHHPHIPFWKQFMVHSCGSMLLLVLTKKKLSRLCNYLLIISLKIFELQWSQWTGVALRL